MTTNPLTEARAKLADRLDKLNADRRVHEDTTARIIAEARGIEFALDALPVEDPEAKRAATAIGAALGAPAAPPAERMTTKKLADKILAGLTIEQQMDGFTLADAGVIVPGQKVGKLEAACNRLVTAGVLVRMGDGYRKMPLLSAAPPANGAGAEA